MGISQLEQKLSHENQTEALGMHLVQPHKLWKPKCLQTGVHDNVNNGNDNTDKDRPIPKHNHNHKIPATVW